MEALILLLIGLVSGLEIGSKRQATERIFSDDEVAEGGLICQPTRDSIWVTNLEEPNAPRWIVEGPNMFCSPLSGERVVLDVEDAEGR